MVFGFGRKSRFRKHLKELQARMLEEINNFAAAVTKEFDPVANNRAIEPPPYPLFLSIGPPKTDTTHLNQLILCLDGLTLFAHALDRLSFRPDSDALAAAVLDPTILELANWLEATVSDITASETTVPAEEILQFAKYRALHYAEATSLLGTSAYDKHTAIWLAAENTAKDLDYPMDVLLTKLIQTQLIRGLANLDLADRVKRLEELL
jgi:hypothetical protein